jgi:hypothetical protein
LVQGAARTVMLAPPPPPPNAKTGQATVIRSRCAPVFEKLTAMGGVACSKISRRDAVQAPRVSALGVT